MNRWTSPTNLFIYSNPLKWSKSRKRAGIPPPKDKPSSPWRGKTWKSSSITSGPAETSPLSGLTESTVRCQKIKSKSTKASLPLKNLRVQARPKIYSSQSKIETLPKTNSETRNSRLEQQRFKQNSIASYKILGVRVRKNVHRFAKPTQPWMTSMQWWVSFTQTTKSATKVPPCG